MNLRKSAGYLWYVFPSPEFPPLVLFFSEVLFCPQRSVRNLHVQVQQSSQSSSLCRDVQVNGLVHRVSASAIAILVLVLRTSHK